MDYFTAVFITFETLALIVLYLGYKSASNLEHRWWNNYLKVSEELKQIKIDYEIED